jgi:DNA polymerase III alpha subunit
LHGHFNVVKQMKPTSIEELAMTLAIIRPGKRHLIGRTWDQLRKEIWEKSNEGYQFKKSHAFAYALAIVVQLNLLVEELNAE